MHVDLCPLTCGLNHICGWYNISDFCGQTRGQLKVRSDACDLLDKRDHSGKIVANCHNHVQLAFYECSCQYTCINVNIEWITTLLQKLYTSFPFLKAGHKVYKINFVFLCSCRLALLPHSALVILLHYWHTQHLSL